MLHHLPTALKYKILFYLSFIQFDYNEYKKCLIRNIHLDKVKINNSIYNRLYVNKLIKNTEVTTQFKEFKSFYIFEKNIITSSNYHINTYISKQKFIAPLYYTKFSIPTIMNILLNYTLEDKIILYELYIMNKNRYCNMNRTEMITLACLCIYKLY